MHLHRPHIYGCPHISVRAHNTKRIGPKNPKLRQHQLLTKLQKRLGMETLPYSSSAYNSEKVDPNRIAAPFAGTARQLPPKKTGNTEGLLSLQYLRPPFLPAWAEKSATPSCMIPLRWNSPTLHIHAMDFTPSRTKCGDGPLQDLLDSHLLYCNNIKTLVSDRILNQAGTPVERCCCLIETIRM